MKTNVRDTTMQMDGWRELYAAKRGGIGSKACQRRLYIKCAAEKATGPKASEAEPPFVREDLRYDMLLTEFLLHKRDAVKESTYAHYCDVVETHIRPRLGSLPLQQMNTKEIDRFTSELLREGRRDKQGGLSPKSVRDILSIVRLSLQYAMDLRLIPAEAVHFSVPRIEQAAMQILSDEEQIRLEYSVRASGSSATFGIYLCLYTGLRIGELCALQWNDIDFENAIISISRTILRIRNTGTGAAKTRIVITSPKTKSSIRRIPLPSFVASALRALQKEAASPEAYVLTGTTRYIEPSNYYVRYKRILRKCGLPDYSFHALRHTFATHCIEKGFDPKSLSEILGHASVGITLNRYVHPSMELKRRCMERLESC